MCTYPLLLPVDDTGHNTQAQCNGNANAQCEWAFRPHATSDLRSAGTTAHNLRQTSSLCSHFHNAKEHVGVTIGQSQFLRCVCVLFQCSTIYAEFTQGKGSRIESNFTQVGSQGEAGGQSSCWWREIFRFNFQTFDF